MVGAWLIVSTEGQGLGTNLNPFVGIAIVLLVGLVVGAFNGLMVIKLGFNAFIFTLAMLILLRGVCAVLPPAIRLPTSRRWPMPAARC